MARRHQKHAESHGNGERWLLTYADLITLLMVFFVVLYSMSSADSTKWQQVSAALQQAFNTDVLQGQTNSIVDAGPQTVKPVDSLISDSEVPQATRLQEAIQASLEQSSRSPQSPDVSVGVDKDGVVIRLSGSYLFDSGRAELKPNSFAVLNAIAAEVRPLDNDIRVDGHTDSIPLQSALYPTNWELSAARALAVTRYLTETDGVQAARLFAAGFGQFRPIVPNDTREQRAQNRRVEIHLLSSVAPTVTASPTPIRPSPDPALENRQP